MKSIIICLALLVMANSVYSQPAKTTAPLTKKDYLQKSKNQNTAAWIVMGGGLGITALGLKHVNHDLGGSDDSRQIVAIVAGLTAVSIATGLFIASTNNKKRAEMLSFRMERAPVIQQRSFVYSSYPALSVRLNF